MQIWGQTQGKQKKNQLWLIWTPEKNKSHLDKCLKIIKTSTFIIT